jgi:hypothetical protein
MGEVKRVDIFDVINVDGTRAGNKRGAFVHMYHWEDDDVTISFLNELEQNGQCQLWLTYNGSRGCYWNVKKMNRDPIQDTELNKHQLADKLREMTLLLKDRDNEIKQLRNELNNKIRQ